MNQQSWCQRCIWEQHPEMLTTYCLAANCDKCGRWADLAMVRVNSAPRPEPSVCIAGNPTVDGEPCGDPECVCAPHVAPCVALVPLREPWAVDDPVLDTAILILDMARYREGLE